MHAGRAGTARECGQAGGLVGDTVVVAVAVDGAELLVGWAVHHALTSKDVCGEVGRGCGNRQTGSKARTVWPEVSCRTADISARRHAGAEGWLTNDALQCYSKPGELCRKVCSCKVCS